MFSIHFIIIVSNLLIKIFQQNTTNPLCTCIRYMYITAEKNLIEFLPSIHAVYSIPMNKCENSRTYIYTIL